MAGTSPIKCRASYDLLEEQNKLQLNIHCASDSYNFDLRGSATYGAGAITGTWSESTRNAAGTMSGKVEGAGFQVLAKGPTFTANLNLVTRGDKQSVTIKSHDAKADVQGATITLQRGQRVSLCPAALSPLSIYPRRRLLAPLLMLSSPTNIGLRTVGFFSPSPMRSPSPRGGPTCAAMLLV
jgi:hypothetical protein